MIRFTARSIILSVFILLSSFMPAWAVISYNFTTSPVDNVNVLLSGSATVTGGMLSLNNLAPGQYGTFEVRPQSVVGDFKATYQQRIYGGTLADGLSFNYGSNYPAGMQGYERGVGNGLSVCFRTYSFNTLEIKYNGFLLALLGLNSRTTTFVPVEIEMKGGALTVRYNNIPYINNLVIPGYNPQPGWSFLLGARTGAAYDYHQIDNLLIETPSALHTDGANDFVEVPRSIQDNFTIEYWMKTTQTGISGGQWYNGNGIVDAEVGGVTNDFGTSLVGSKVAFGIGNPDVTIFSTTNVNDGTWHHVAAVRNAASDTLQLYVDGVLEASTSAGGVQSLNVPPRITIGSMQSGVSSFNGTVDEVRLWNVARTASEIQGAMNIQLPSDIAGLAAYYTMDEGDPGGNNAAITTLADATTAGNTGTLTNFALNGNSSNFVYGTILSPTPIYTVTPNAGANGSLAPGTAQTVNYGDTTSFTVTPDTGYHIGSVTGCGGTLNGNTYTTGAIIADCTVSATFAIDTFTVTPSAGPNGTISPNTPQTVNYNNTTSFTISPDTGYHFDDATSGTDCPVVSFDGTTLVLGPITQDCGITANFAIDTFTVTPSAGPNGTISPNAPQTVNYNDTTSFTVTPSLGYYIGTVSGCGGTTYTGTTASTGAMTYNTGAITANCQVNASFSRLVVSAPATLTVIPPIAPSVYPMYLSMTKYATVNWGATQTPSTTYELQVSFNGGSFRTIYQGPNLTWRGVVTRGIYVYRVRANRTNYQPSDWMTSSPMVVR